MSGKREEYAKAAGIVDEAEIANVGHFVKQTPGPAAAKRFGANALAVALQAVGVTMN